MSARSVPAELPPLPLIEPATTADLIVAFISSQMEQTGFSRIVVGLSGGVDSATVAFLAARAVGADNLLAVRMPYRSSSRGVPRTLLARFASCWKAPTISPGLSCPWMGDGR